jgi:hypothetical protein
LTFRRDDCERRVDVRHLSTGNSSRDMSVTREKHLVGEADCDGIAAQMGGSAMSSQFKAVTIAFVAGLAITLLAQWSDVIRMATSASFDASRFSGNVISYWTGMLSGMPLIFVVIAIVATAHKAGLRNSILAGLGAVVAVFGVSFVIICAAIAFAPAYPQRELPFADAGEARNSFVRGASDSCAQKQKALPQNKDVPASAIDAYCSCFGNSLADVATRAEVASMSQRQTTPSLVEKFKTASDKCTRLVQRQP